MTTELVPSNPELSLTQYHGGDLRGQCVQLSARDHRPQLDDYGLMLCQEGYVSISRENAPALIADLQAWLDGTIRTEHDPQPAEEPTA